MKCRKLLPIVIVLPLISGCIPSPKKPHFADVGQQVKFADFSANLTKKYEKCDINSTKPISSGNYKDEYRTHSLSLYLDQGKVRTKTESKNYIGLSAKYDKNNKIIHKEGRSGSYFYSKDKKNEKVTEDSERTSKSLQFQKVDGKAYCVTAEKSNKEISKLAEVTQEQTMEKILDADMKSILSEIGVSFTGLIEAYKNNMNEREKRSYTFYQNGNIFTLEENYVYSTELKEENLIYGTSEQKSDLKMQVDLTNGDYRFLVYYCSTYEIQYIENYYDIYKKGDSSKTKFEYSIETTYKYGDVSLKPFNTSDYAIIGEW